MTENCALHPFEDEHVEHDRTEPDARDDRAVGVARGRVRREEHRDADGEQRPVVVAHRQRGERFQRRPIDGHEASGTASATPRATTTPSSAPAASSDTDPDVAIGDVLPGHGVDPARAGGDQRVADGVHRRRHGCVDRDLVDDPPIGLVHVDVDDVRLQPAEGGGDASEAVGLVGQLDPQRERRAWLLVSRRRVRDALISSWWCRGGDDRTDRAAEVAVGRTRRALTVGAVAAARRHAGDELGHLVAIAVDVEPVGRRAPAAAAAPPTPRSGGG